MWAFRGRAGRTLVLARHDDGGAGEPASRRGCCDITIGDTQMHAIPLETLSGRLMRCVAGFGPCGVQVTSKSHLPTCGPARLPGGLATLIGSIESCMRRPILYVWIECNATCDPSNPARSPRRPHRPPLLPSPAPPLPLHARTVSAHPLFFSAAPRSN